jgi:hypothetical protein
VDYCRRVRPNSFYTSFVTCDTTTDYPGGLCITTYYPSKTCFFFAGNEICENAVLPKRLFAKRLGDEEERGVRELYIDPIGP